MNEQFLDDTNEKTSFLYIGVHGPQYNPGLPNFNNVRAP